MVGVEPLYLIYDIYFVGDPQPRVLILPIPPLLGAVAYQAMVEAEDFRLLRAFVTHYAAGKPFYREAWFPGSTPVVMTWAEHRARWPDKVPAEGWRELPADNE
jgi:hypothetical protein